MIPLSPSRIKTLKECHWLYHATYILNIPRTHNEGSCRGDIVHHICEELSKPENKGRYDKMIAVNKLSSDKEFLKEAEKRLSDNNFLNQENMDLIEKMLFRALKYDFFGEKIKGLKKHYSEIDFDTVVSVEDKKFRMRGFIDKLFLKDNNTAIIRDFKTSKETFKGEDLNNNIQDLMYRMAVKELFPEVNDIDFEFLFIKFDLNKKGYVVMERISDVELLGAKYELLEISEFLDSFDIEAAHSNFAGTKGYPKEGFSGILKCGKPYRQTKNKTTGQWDFKLENGKKIKSYMCSARLPFDYYALVDENDKMIVGTSVFAKDLEKLKKKAKKGQKIKLFHYEGCPYWKESDRAAGFHNDKDLRLDFE